MIDELAGAILNRNSELKTKPLNLTPEEIKDPRKVIDDFFEYSDLEGHRVVIKYVRDQALLSKSRPDGHRIVRSLEDIVRLIEAFYLVKKKEC